MKSWKKRFFEGIILFILAGVLYRSAIYRENTYVYQYNSSYTIELGEPVEITPDLFLKGSETALSKITMNESSIDDNKCGEYRIDLTSGKDKYTANIVIQDTIEPEIIALKSQLEQPLILGTSISIMDLYGTFSVVDKSSWKITFDNDQREIPVSNAIINKEGALCVSLKSVDAYGNISYKDFELKVPYVFDPENFPEWYECMSQKQKEDCMFWIREGGDEVTSVEDLEEMYDILGWQEMKNKLSIEEEGEIAPFLKYEVYGELYKLKPGIVQRFIDEGWKMVLTDSLAEYQYILDDEFGELLGATMYDEKKIHLLNTDAYDDLFSGVESTLHEMGHYVDCTMGFPSETDEFTEIYQAEKGLYYDYFPEGWADYTISEQDEYFAEVFSDICTQSSQEETSGLGNDYHKIVPRTYEFIQNIIDEM